MNNPREADTISNAVVAIAIQGHSDCRIVEINVFEIGVVSRQNS
jgi:hypothetical protein